MARTANVLNSSPFRARGWREGWLLLRDLMGGALVLAVWIAVWTVTWAAVAGPLKDDAPAGRASIAAVEQL